jgi:dTDP-4-amino-4,6-dideoxygalactose transaminase
MSLRFKERVRDSFLIFGSPLIEKPEIDEVCASLRSGWLSTGPKVARFEELFRAYIGSKHALALNSCTAGLHLSLLVGGVGPGDEVITSPMTFASTANVVVHVGAKPVFVDIELPSMNINPDLIEEKISNKTKAIIPVHFAGRPCDMDKIMDIARRYNLIVIEDAAHALGAEYKTRKIGTIGDLSCFSFNVVKNITTGEGGMVTTDNDDWAEMIRMYSLHGMNKGNWERFCDKKFGQYQILLPGYKYSMMDIQAAIGIHQLKRVNKYHERRKEIWCTYNEAFKDLPMDIPFPEEENIKHSYCLYTILLDSEKSNISRYKFQEKLYDRKIITGINFVSLHLHPYYRNTFGYKRGDFPNAEYVSDRTLSLPLSPKLTNEDVDYVINSVRNLLELKKIRD